MNERYAYTANQPLDFLKEISEDYANSRFFGSDPEIILMYAEKTLGKIPNIQFYINKQLKEDDDNGDNEFISTFKWKCTNDIELMKKWFCLLYKLGGDPYIENVQGKNAFDICRERMLEEGYEESEVSSFLQKFKTAY